MPIYEYQALTPEYACNECRNGFETLQQIHDKPLMYCRHCGNKVKKIISWCRSAVIETSETHVSVSNKIAEYENSGMWSHAAELADKYSENIKDKNVTGTLREDFNMTVSGGLGKLKGLLWRIGLMGINSSERNVILALEALERALKKEGYPIKLGSSVVAAMENLSSNQ